MDLDSCAGSLLAVALVLMVILLHNLRKLAKRTRVTANKERTVTFKLS